MLAADKLQLQSALKQQATALKEKEFNLHHSNLMTVGTQAAVLAGLDITMFIEFNPPHNDDWHEDIRFFPRIVKCMYYILILSAFCSNMIVVSHTTALSVLGAGMALRGPDGSMMTATDGLYEERKTVFVIFGVGLGCTVSSVVLGVCIFLPWESAICGVVISVMTCRAIWKNYIRVSQRFDFDEKDTVDFRDIMEGPAAIQAIPMIRKAIDTVTRTGARSPTTTSSKQKKSSSYSQLDMSDSYDNASDDSSWRQSSSNNSLTSRNAKRRGRSNSPREQFIQTV